MFGRYTSSWNAFLLRVNFYFALITIFITVHQRSCWKVMFSQSCVKNSVHGRGGGGREIYAPLLGRQADTLPGRHPPGEKTPLGRPPPLQADPPRADTSPRPKKKVVACCAFFPVLTIAGAPAWLRTARPSGWTWTQYSVDALTMVALQETNKRRYRYSSSNAEWNFVCWIGYIYTGSGCIGESRRGTRSRSFSCSF